MIILCVRKLISREKNDVPISIKTSFGYSRMLTQWAHRWVQAWMSMSSREATIRHDHFRDMLRSLLGETSCLVKKEPNIPSWLRGHFSVPRGGTPLSSHPPQIELYPQKSVSTETAYRLWPTGNESPSRPTTWNPWHEVFWLLCGRLVKMVGGWWPSGDSMTLYQQREQCPEILPKTDDLRGTCASTL